MPKDTSKAAYDAHLKKLRASGKSAASSERDTRNEFRQRQTANEQEQRTREEKGR